MKNNLLKIYISAFIILFCVVSNCFAITIDSFSKDQGPVADLPNGVSVVSDNYSELPALTTMIGGTRTLESLVLSGVAGKASSEASSGFYFFSNDSGIQGRGNVIWDGDNNNALNFTGLGGISFFQDNADAINVVVPGFDYANSKPVSIFLTVYTDQTHFSTAAIVLNAQINSSTLLQYFFRNAPGALPANTVIFNTGLGANGPADFSSIGAIVMSIVLDPSGTGSDLTIDSVTTDGDCDLVPDANKNVKDVCGKCGGTTKVGDILKDCTDCLGIPNGNSLPGVSCNSGSPGVCTDGTYSSPGPMSCSCVPNTPSSGEKCDSLDNDCDGETDEGFTPEKGTSCSIGTAPCVENGTIVCSVNGGVTCNASATNVQACENSKGCDGQPNSGLVRDICDVCGGDGKSCLGCDNQPFSGLTNDICNLCGGNGTSCLDCTGTPFGTAQQDRCGVCNGNGQSCIRCTTVSQFATFNSMDQSAKFQETAVRVILKRISNFSKKDVKLQKYIALTRATAHKLQDDNWILSWTTMAIDNSQCQTSPFCFSVNYTTNLDIYRGRANELHQLGVQALAKLKKLKGKTFTKADAGLIKKVNSAYKEAILAVNSALTTHSTCS